MAGYVIVKKSDGTNHTLTLRQDVPANKPYINVKVGNATSYLPLTSDNTAGKGVLVKVGGKNYKVVETYTTTQQVDTSSTGTYEEVVTGTTAYTSEAVQVANVLSFLYSFSRQSGNFSFGYSVKNTASIFEPYMYNQVIGVDYSGQSSYWVSAPDYFVEYHSTKYYGPGETYGLNGRTYPNNKLTFWIVNNMSVDETTFSESTSYATTSASRTITHITRSIRPSQIISQLITRENTRYSVTDNDISLPLTITRTSSNKTTSFDFMYTITSERYRITSSIGTLTSTSYYTTTQQTTSQ